MPDFSITMWFADERRWVTSDVCAYADRDDITCLEAFMRAGIKALSLSGQNKPAR